MKYNGFDIQRNIITGKYNIFDAFGEKSVEKDFITPVEAKAAVDEIIKEHKSNRFQPSHYSRYWWAVMDKNTGWYYRDENNKMVMFKTRQECFDWCDEQNKLHKSETSLN